MGLAADLLGKAADFLTKAASGKSGYGGLGTNTGGNIKFPDNLGGDRYPHLMRFQAIEYPQYKMYQGGLGDTVSTIYTYVPESIAFTQNHDWSNFNLAEYLQNYEVVGNLIGAGGTKIAEAIGYTTKDEFDGTAAAVELVGKLGSSIGINDPGGRFALAGGLSLAVNPRYELLFNSTTPRQFVLDFRFLPKNKLETLAIRDIINQFQKWSLPSAENFRTRYYTPPCVWKIEFLFGGSRNKMLLPFLSAACVGVDVSYPNGGGGTFATFSDGAPIETALQLRFAETNAMTRELYDQLTG